MEILLGKLVQEKSEPLSQNVMLSVVMLSVMVPIFQAFHQTSQIKILKEEAKGSKEAFPF